MSDYDEVKLDAPLEDTSTDDLKKIIDGEVPEEVEQEPEEKAAPEPEPEPQATEPPEEKEETPSELELMRLEMERLKVLAEKAEHFRQAHDKLTGEYGNLNRKYLDAVRTRQKDTGDYGVQSDELDEVKAELDRLREADRRRAVDEANRALIEEAQSFTTQYPDVKDYSDDIRKHLESRYPLVQEALEAADPQRVRQITRDLVREAYFSARENALRTKLAEAEEKRKKANETIKDRKLAASASSSGGTRVAKRVPPVDLKTMPLDDLKKLVDSMGG